MLDEKAIKRSLARDEAFRTKERLRGTLHWL